MGGWSTRGRGGSTFLQPSSGQCATSSLFEQQGQHIPVEPFEQEFYAKAALQQATSRGREKRPSQGKTKRHRKGKGSVGNHGDEGNDQSLRRKQSLEEVVTLTQSSTWVQSARKRLASRLYATSTQATKKSKRKKIRENMSSCCISIGNGGVGCDALLTMAAVLGESNIKSADQYLGKVKLLQLQGVSWSDVLERPRTRCESKGTDAEKIDDETWEQKGSGRGIPTRVSWSYAWQRELLSSIAKAVPPMNASLVVPFMAPYRPVSVRCAAVAAIKALASAASASHPGVLAALVGAAPLYTKQGIFDSSPKVRLLALEVFEQLNSKALRIIKAVGGRLQDEDDMVREAAVRTLSVLSADGKEAEVSTAIHSALDALRHPASAIRSCAIRCLCQIGRGNSVAMSGLAACLGAPDVQSTACLALLKVAGARKAIKVALSCLESASQRHRDVVPHCLQVMAGQVPGQWMVRCMKALLPRYLSHKEPRTRLAALKVLGRWNKESAKGRTISKEGKGDTLSNAVADKAVLRRVGLRLLDKHPAVREETYRLASKLGFPCRMELLAPLACHMAHRQRQKLVARAFDVLGEDNCCTISLLRPALKHKCPNARAAAIQVLARLCVKKKLSCTLALQAVLDTVQQDSSQEIAATGQQAIVGILGAAADGEGSVSKELLEATSRIEGPRICIAVAKMCNDLSPVAFDGFLHRLLCMLQACDQRHG
eukprot:s1543_g38.t1